MYSSKSTNHNVFARGHRASSTSNPENGIINAIDKVINRQAILTRLFGGEEAGYVYASKEELAAAGAGKQFKRRIYCR